MRDREGGTGIGRRTFIAVGAAAGAVIGVGALLPRRRAGAMPAVNVGTAPESVTVTEFDPSGAPTGRVTVPKLAKTDAQWRRQLSPLAYDVLRRFDDEMAFSGAYWKNHEAGIYRCAACDTPAFSSAHKFDSGTGWPSFTQPIAAGNVRLDKQGPAVRVVCVRCDSFLGDLFDDGPKPDGWRYCINSVSLRFVPANAPSSATAVFSGGCFWGVDAVYKHVRGVQSVTSGYAGGAAATANYETVSGGDTGHAESVRVTYDPRVVAYDTLLTLFFLVAHDPTQKDRQGPDVGTQYRSAIFYADAAQRAAAERAIRTFGANGAWRRPIVTELTALDRFYPAEAYHQNYLAQHMTQPYIVYNDLPKLDALKREFPEWYREAASR